MLFTRPPYLKAMRYMHQVRAASCGFAQCHPLLPYCIAHLPDGRYLVSFVCPDFARMQYQGTVAFIVNKNHHIWCAQVAQPGDKRDHIKTRVTTFQFGTS